MPKILSPSFNRLSFGLVSAAAAPPAFTQLEIQDVIDTGANPQTLTLTAVPSGTTRVIMVGITIVTWSTPPTINGISMTSDAFISITGVRDMRIWGVDTVANPSIIGQTSMVVQWGGPNTIAYNRVFALSGTSGGPKSVIQDNNGNAGAAGGYTPPTGLTTGVAAGNLAFMAGFCFNQASDFTVSPTESAGAGNTVSSVGWNRAALVAQTIVSASGSFNYSLTYSGNNIPGVIAGVYGA